MAIAERSPSSTPSRLPAPHPPAPTPHPVLESSVNPFQLVGLPNGGLGGTEDVGRFHIDDAVHFTKAKLCRGAGLSVLIPPSFVPPPSDLTSPRSPTTAATWQNKRKKLCRLVPGGAHGSPHTRVAVGRDRSSPRFTRSLISLRIHTSIQPPGYLFLPYRFLPLCGCLRISGFRPRISSLTHVYSCDATITDSVNLFRRPDRHA